MKKQPGRKVRFELEAEAGSQVAVAGTFNDWDPAKNPMNAIPASGSLRQQ
jgi:1,4-alpha-glucan branching enzyme